MGFTMERESVKEAKGDSRGDPCCNPERLPSGGVRSAPDAGTCIHAWATHCLLAIQVHDSFSCFCTFGWTRCTAVCSGPRLGPTRGARRPSAGWILRASRPRRPGGCPSCGCGARTLRCGPLQRRRETTYRRVAWPTWTLTCINL